MIPLKDRQATTWIQPFLDRIVFTFGAPDQLQSDDAPEFVSEAMELLAHTAGIKTTTTLGHNARGNGTIEVWWRYWNRCLRLLSDEHYVRWPEFASRIAFAYNASRHEGIGSIAPFQVQHGAMPNNSLASAIGDAPVLSEGEELALPAQFAEALALSTSVFSQLAKTHDTFVRTETAARLNKKGTTTTFASGDKVKVRVPPTQAQLLATGRRAKHITAWRGPCTVLERLSTTSYAIMDDTTHRRYERVVSNMAPYRAAKAKVNPDAQYNQHYSNPLVEGEFIAIRDNVSGPYYIAEVMAVDATTVNLHYYGCTEVVLAAAVFKPCWHEIASNDIVLAKESPQPYDDHITHIPYAGDVDIKDIHLVLVARNLEFTKAGKLRFRALRALAPVHDQLFRFQR